MRFLLLTLIFIVSAQATDKIALLIGNSNYTHLDKLYSPKKDIPALAQRLRDIGFDVEVVYNRDKRSMKDAIRNFQRKLLRNPNAIALFYYSGHGSQAYGESYLIPIDGDTQDQADVEADGIKVEWIAQKMAIAKTKANILFLDACRDVPVGIMGGTKGLGQVKRQPSATLILYSTSKNKTARDNRLFNSVVLEKLALNQPFISVANDISYTVRQKTGGSQVPELLSTGLPNIVLAGYTPPTPQPTTISTPKPKITSKWIRPTKSVCEANGGVIYEYGECKANWENAKKICSASGGKLPTREDFYKVIKDCGGIPNADNEEWYKNENNSYYQNCYKQKGLSNKYYYWTSETYDSARSRYVNFESGFDLWDNLSNKNYTLCVR